MKLEAWREAVVDLEVVVSSRNIEARLNTLLFQIGAAVEEGISVDELEDFLTFCSGHYALKAQELGARGLFYAWLDEISGTVRCSFTTSLRHDELPFACNLGRLDSLRMLAASALSSAYAVGIPWHELSDSPEEEEEPRSFVLPVYSERVGNSSAPE